MNRLEQAWDWIRESPAHWAIVGAVALAAIVTGSVLATVIGDARDDDVGAVPSASQGGSVAPSASEGSEEPSASPSASPTPAASEEPSAEPSASPTAVPTHQGTPVPTTEGGHGGGEAPVYGVTGTWDRLSDMPGGSDFLTADALRLPDGRVAVFRWDYGQEDPSDPEVVLYDPDADAWVSAEFEGERPFIGTDQSFALADDGYLHTFDYRIDIDDDTWSVEPDLLITEADIWAGSNLAADADGVVYRRAQDTGGGRTELVIHHLADEREERSAPVAETYELVYADPAGTLVMVRGDVEISLVRCDPAVDAWSDPVATVAPGIDAWHAAVGPDGDLYAPSFYPDFPGLFAISPDDGSVRAVELPEGVTSWDVELLWDDDGRLDAFGTDDAWVFTPDP